MNRMFDLHGRLDPRDRQDARWYLSTDTKMLLQQRYATHVDNDRTKVQQAFGIPIEIDDTLPPGAVKLLAETETDRALRRAARDGLMTYVMPRLELPQAFPVPPAPTLKALLKHWLRKVKR